MGRRAESTSGDGQRARGQGRDRHRRRQRDRPRHRRAVRRRRRAASSSPTSTPSRARSWRRRSATRPRSGAPTSPTPTRCRRSSTSPSSTSAGSHVMFNNAGIAELVRPHPRQRPRRLRPGDGGQPLRRDARHAARRRATWRSTAAARSSTPRRSPRSPAAPDRSCTASSKAAVVQFSRSTAIDLADVRHPRELHRAGPHRHRDHQLRHGPGDPADAAAAAPRRAGRRRRTRCSTSRATGRRRSPGSCCRSTAARSPGRRSTQLRDLMTERRRGDARCRLTLVIRGGTVVDGTGAPGRVADVAIADGAHPRDRRRPARRARARRRRLRRRAGLHRHPHALRRAGVLGSGAAAVVVPRASPPWSPATAASRSRRRGPSTTT